MEISTKFSVDGLNETIQMMQDLPPEIEKKIIVSVLGSNANTYIAKPIRALYSSFDAESKKGIKTVRHKHGGIGVKTGLVGTAPYKIRWVDAGTKIRVTKHGWNRGEIKALNQIEPLIERQIQPMLKNIEENFSNDVNKVVERLTRKINKSLL